MFKFNELKTVHLEISTRCQASCPMCPRNYHGGLENPNLKIELGGHTDNTGDKKANQILSENRARAVQEYLLQIGKIGVSRLSYKGYGDSRPKVPNDSPENKAKNRRTEFKVTGK